MSVTKHKVFKISISEDDKLDLDQKALESINSFLVDPNVVYISHAITTFSISKRDMNAYKLSNRLLVVSLVYKDLKETPMELTKTSKKTITTVKKSIEQNSQIPAPNYQTNFEKKLESKKGKE